jgi:hypothetical protein
MSEDKKLTEGHKLSDDIRKEIIGESALGSGFNGHYFRAKKPFRAALSTPMPAGAIQQHPSKKFLSTIKAIFIIERLNDVFGILGWDFEHEIVGTYDNTVGTEVRKQIVVRGRIYIREFDLYTPVQYGGKDLDGKGQEPVDGFKSAVTDALTKCASFLEIGIQVFKGDPNSQQANKSRRPEQHTTPEPAPPAPTPEEATPSTEPTVQEVEMQELREEHKRVFGKLPNKNWSAETIAERIEKKIDEMNQPKEAPQQETPPPPAEKDEPAPPAPAQGMQPNDEFDMQSPEKSYMPMKDEEPEEVEAEDVEGTPLESALSKIDSFLSAQALKEEAGNIVFDAQMEGASDEDIKSIKAAANDKYQELLK